MNPVPFPIACTALLVAATGCSTLFDSESSTNNADAAAATMIDANTGGGDGPDVDAMPIVQPDGDTLVCAEGFTFTGVPVLSNVANQISYTHQTEGWVFVMMTFSGAGVAVATNEQTPQGGPPFTWTYEFTAPAAGLYTATFVGKFGSPAENRSADCDFIVENAGS